MKKYFFIWVFVCLCLAGNAQMYYSDGSYDDKADKAWRDSVRKITLDAHITGLKTYRFHVDSTKAKRKNNGSLVYEWKYDDKGNVTSFIKNNKKGRTKEHYSYLWNDNNQFLQSTSFKRNGKIKYQMVNTYDKTGNCVETWRYFWDAPPNHKLQKFDDNHKLQEIIWRYDNDKKLSGRYEFSYYPDGSKKLTVEYNKKGKIKHTWNYDCSPVGKLTSAKFKDTTKVCIKYEKDKDGNVIKVKEEFFKSGNLARKVDKLDSHNNLLDVAYYNKKGKCVMHTAMSYNSKNQMTEYITYRKGTDRIRSRDIYQYNPDGEIGQTNAFDRNNKPKYILKYVYIKNS